MLEGSQVFVWEFLKTGGLGVPKEFSGIYIYIYTYTHTQMYDYVDILAIRLSEGHGGSLVRNYFGLVVQSSRIILCSYIRS